MRISNAYADWLIEEQAERRRARTATYCCHECGEKRGKHRKGIDTYHTGRCDVCLMDGVALCHVRRYGWLYKAKVPDREEPGQNAGNGAGCS